ncbi:MAG TPA: FlgD immunoglobulin-like domain containing protein [bacterium]|nr:FlgD immunoglobulin-like domain containing protein [bacterium]HPN45414.1 FlgD immunoglobulin-like domain containing protein [bacterium]
MLNEELNAGAITTSDYIDYQLQAIYHPETLSLKYQALLPEISRTATGLKLQLLSLWPGLTAEQQEGYQHYFNRPSFDRLELSLVSPSGLFKIHFTQNGPDAATDEFINNVALSFDYSYNYEVNILGFMPPPVDDPENPEYDIYVYNFGDYGASTPENPVTSTTRDDYTGWIEMDNDFTHTLTKGLGAIQVTAAHEFFHLIQFGYRVFMNTEANSIFLFEATAAWMEDVVFDDVNDYYNYLPYFFNYPYYSFSQIDGAHEYAMCIFFHYLEKKYSRSITKQIWEQFIDSEPYEAIEQSLAMLGSNLNYELADFAIWNYYTGARADTILFYPEGNYYPQLKEQGSYEVNNTLSFQDDVTQLGFNYYRITASASGDYAIRPSFSDQQYWIYAVIVEPYDSPAYYTYCGGNGIKNLLDVRALSNILLIPIYAKKPASSTISNANFTMQLTRGNTPQLEDKIIAVFPNPANLSQFNNVNILFQLEKIGDDITVSIFNENGKIIKKAAIGKQPDGINSYVWDGTNENNEPVASGIYLVFIEADGLIGPGKIALIR